MSKFKKGDIVRYTRNKESKVYRVAKVTKLESKEYLHFSGFNNLGNFFSGEYTLVCRPSEQVKPASYPNPPHKHADIIKAWADGAEIQKQVLGEWVNITLPRGLCPNFKSGHIYRIKPDELRAKEIELKEAEKEVARIKAEMKRLSTEGTLL